MEVLERLEYAFTVAEKEFEVHRLLDPTGMFGYCLPVTVQLDFKRIFFIVRP